MNRGRMLALLGAAFAPLPARASDEFDPATQSQGEQLRVLLGTGDVAALPGGGFTFDGVPYRGRYERLGDGRIVETVRLEEYLYSVVPREMTSSWPASALEAQAICARTYVLARSDPRRAYDVVPSEIDQVYGGVRSESPAARIAVDATAGEVLRFGDGFAQIVYSSCCGGHTEASSDAWGGAPIPYLNGVACTTCTDSPYYRWTRTLNLAQIANRFAAELAPFGALQRIEAGPLDASGRLRSVTLVANAGTVQIKGSTFRLRVGARTLPSLLISQIGDLDRATGEIVVQGGGLGHGVGLCQWGARGLARTGASFREILSFYFPGTAIDHD